MMEIAPLRPLYDNVTDDSLRLAILLGLATIPFTLALSWEPVSVSGDGGVNVSVSGEPLLLAGLLVGYRYSQRATESRRAGLWTGLVGSIATVLVFVASAATAVASASSGMTVVAVVLIPIAVVLGVGFNALITMVSAVVADRVTERLRNRDGSETTDTASEHAAPSRWWRAIPIYALVAPVALLIVLWVGPDSDVGSTASMLGVLVLVVLAPVAFVALFIDVTEPRTGWVPSVGLYVGAPLSAAALVYLGADVQGRTYPAGDAWYGFFVALWITAAVYLADRYRHTGTLQFVGG